MPRGGWWIIETLSLVALLCIPAFILIHYASLPETIPTHFKWSGTPTAFGPKSTLMVIANAAAFSYLVMTVVPFFPSLVNVPGPRTPAKIEIAISMVRILKLEVISFQAYLLWAMIETGAGRAEGINGTVHQTALFILLGTVGIAAYKTYRNAR